MVVQSVSRLRNTSNALIALAVPLPSVVIYWRGDLAHLHPIVGVNVLFFLNVCVLFWLISLAQRSAWLIDPYWTIIPLFIAHFYAAQSTAIADPWRTRMALACLWLWSVRLTHNYFRRERYQFGAREDWRFALKRKESRHFWWYSFFYAFVSQQIMLVGLTLPYWAIQTTARPFGGADIAIAATAVAGIAIAYFADTQLARYMARDDKPLILDTGLWRYSRHPNYFGEQLFWWAVAAWGVLAGHPWTVVGTLVNSAGLAVVTRMTERRMEERPERREAWLAYKRRTSAWALWPPSG